MGPSLLFFIVVCAYSHFGAVRAVLNNNGVKARNR